MLALLSLFATSTPEPWTSRVTVVCFLASYTLALVLEVLHLYQRRPVLWVLALLAGLAGLLAETIYLAVQRPPLAWQFGTMLFVAWVLAVFYLVGSLHYNRMAWGVFVLPVILGLVGLGLIGTLIDPPPPDMPRHLLMGWFSPRGVHALLLVMGAIGVSVGFVVSLMYLFQAQRLKAKLPPGQGMRLLNLERLEEMNRRAVTLAFPLLTVGMGIGAVLMIAESKPDWLDPRVLSAAVAWLAVAILVYLRYGQQVRGRQAAFLTILAFALLVGCLTLSHPVGQIPWRPGGETP